MDVLKNKNQCIGCGLCADVCGVSCITMVSADGGFLYPFIDDTKCVSCNKCRDVCPVLKEKTKISPKGCYALIDNNEESRLKSASGGASAMFMQETINKGNVVCACRLDDNLKAVHIVFENIEEIDSFRDSKYVQSDMSSAWAEINSLLKQNRKVFISGTPCQIAAVKSRFGENDNITTCDFVCSGVPDPAIFEFYKADLEKESGKKIKKFYFRDKTNGWKASNIKVVYDDCTEQVIERKNSYYFKLFGSNLFFRECCYDCRFKDFNVYSDITVGDYWGIHKFNPDMDDDKGCSLVIVNSEKGEKLLCDIEERCTVVQTPLSFAIDTHPKLIKSIDRSVFRDWFYGIYDGDEKTFRKAMRLYTNNSVLVRAIKSVYSRVKRKKKI